MSEICTRTQAKNIVEYVWRKRNHNDGKVVVVNLPDGRREVCEVKNGN